MRRPVWLLDVDGVLNAARPGWGAAPQSGTAYGAGQPFRLRWAPALVTRIRDIHSSGRADIRWCSTWCSDADQVERLLGLPRLDRAWHHPLSSTAATVAKLAAARAVLDQGRRLIWTDDEAIPTASPLRDELVGDTSPAAVTGAPEPGLARRPNRLEPS